jgi:hypothetical protein
MQKQYIINENYYIKIRIVSLLAQCGMHKIGQIIS